MKFKINLVKISSFFFTNKNSKWIYSYKVNKKLMKTQLSLIEGMWDARGNYTIFREYIKCVLLPLTEVMDPIN